MTSFQTPKATGSFLNSVFHKSPSFLISLSNFFANSSRFSSGPHGLISSKTIDFATGGAFFFLAFAFYSSAMRFFSASSFSSPDPKRSMSSSSSFLASYLGSSFFTAFYFLPSSFWAYFPVWPSDFLRSLLIFMIPAVPAMNGNLLSLLNQSQRFGIALQNSASYAKVKAALRLFQTTISARVSLSPTSQSLP